MEKWGHKKTSIFLTSCILVMLLIFYVAVDFTFAWLFTYVEKESTGVTTLGKIDSSHTATSEIEITMPQANNTLSLADKVLITNTGSVDALLRVFYTIYIDETSKQIATTSAINSLKINNTFVPSDENIENVYSGYYYYNSYVPAGGNVNFFTSIVPTSEIASKSIKIKVMYEFVNYTGGAYQLGQDLPWGNTPAAWAFNYDYVTKVESSVISPKFDIKFADVSKIQLTAKTTSADHNILFCRYNGAYIGLNGGNWVFNKLTATANITATQFTNGDFNTVTFNIDACSASTDDYIMLVWDSVWSKDVSYKQIKIWDKNGDLIYNLVPKVTTNNAGDVNNLGLLYDNVSKTNLNMYQVSGDTLTSTTNVYEGFSEVLFFKDFENFSEGASSVLAVDQGAKATTVSNNGCRGNMCAIVTNTVDVDTVSSTEYARFSYLLNLKKGYRYTFSIWVKTTAPISAMTFKKIGGVLYADLSHIMIVKTTDGERFLTSYYCNDNWQILSVTTDVITEDANYWFQFSVPTGTTYNTYIDDIIVRAHL